MKKMALLVVLAVLASRTTVNSADSAHRVVFELTSGRPETWQSVLNNVENVRKALGSVAVEVVAHGKGLDMLRSSTSGPVRERLERIAGEGVVFSACRNTMQRENVRESELVPFAKTVDSGVAEVVRKQEAGWSYVRSGS